MKPQELFLYSAIPADRDRFAASVYWTASQLGIAPEWLMTVMHFESKLSPQARNPRSSATGLIQFMNATATSLGTTTAALYNMDGVTQMNYVYKYLKPFKGRMNNLGDVYLSVFYPAAVGKGDGYTIPLSQAAVAANEVLDVDNSGTITAGEVRTKINSYFNTLRQKFPLVVATTGGVAMLLLTCLILYKVVS